VAKDGLNYSFGVVICGGGEDIWLRVCGGGSVMKAE
jgi:hypothetical protein